MSQQLFPTENTAGLEPHMDSWSGRVLTWDFATSVWAAPLPFYQIRSRGHVAESPHCPGLLNLGLHPKISHPSKYSAINMHACLFWQMTANWRITLLSCARVVCDILQKIRSLQLLRYLVMMDILQVRAGMWDEQVCWSLRSSLNCGCLRYLASPDHQENYAG